MNYCAGSLEELLFWFIIAKFPIANILKDIFLMYIFNKCVPFT